MKKFIQLTNLRDKKICLKVKKITFFIEHNYFIIKNDIKEDKIGSKIFIKGYEHNVKETVDEIKELISPSK